MVKQKGKLGREDKNMLGFTLTEVLVALLISGILLTVSLNFLTDQWRLSGVLKDRNEAHYAVMNAGRMVLDAIREAKEVSWDSSQRILRVYPADEMTSSPDEYFIGDRDWDGIKDLYRTHDGVPGPLVSGLENWNCSKGDGGLWTVTLQAKIGKQTVEWKGSMRPRSTQVLNLVILPFLS